MSFVKGFVVAFCLVGIVFGQSAPLVVQNETLRVTCQSETGHFRVTRVDSDQTVAEGRFITVEGPARTVELMDPWFGAGRAISVAGDGGSNARIKIFPKLPFVLFQGSIHNGRAIDMTENRVPLVGLDLLWPGLADAVTTLGTGGLMPAAQASGSYGWLAVADPDSRAGVVGAWLTHDRASGVIFPSVKEGRLSLLARADYGHLWVSSGGNVDTETFALGVFDDARVGLETWADTMARIYGVHPRDQLSGYRTGTLGSSGQPVNAEALDSLVRLSAEKLKPYGMGVVQIGDGWQMGNAQGNGPRKNFTSHDPEGPFPKGMLGAANRIRDLDFTAGLWCMPFSGTFNDAPFSERQHLFAKTADGKAFDTPWTGTALDMTVHETREYVTSLIQRICGDWGFGTITLAGLSSGLGVRQVYPNEGYREDRFGEAMFHDSTRTPVEIYRQALTWIREAAGEEAYLLGSGLPQNMRPYGASFGLLDGMCLGSDNARTWEEWVKHTPASGTRHYFLHHRLWHNDPGAVLVGPDMTLDQAQAICSWTGLSGQRFATRDWIPDLPEERLTVLQRTMASHHRLARPVDVFDCEPARVWIVTDDEGPVRRDVVGLYNWGIAAHQVEMTPPKLGLPQAREYVAFDYWGDRFLPPFVTLRAPVAGQACRVLAVRPLQSWPQLLSTSQHITQGMTDVLAEAWDAGAQTLAGKSIVQAADPYELRIVVPVARQSWRVQQVKVDDETVTVDWRQQGPRVRVTLTRPAAGEVQWSVLFAKDSVSRPAPPQDITLLKAESDTQEVRLSWKPCRADAYRLTRQDGRVVEIEEAQWTDPDVVPGQLYVYQVQAVVWDQASTATEVSMRVKELPEQ